jgi:hypothetical protein
MCACTLVLCCAGGLSQRIRKPVDSLFDKGCDTAFVEGCMAEEESIDDGRVQLIDRCFDVDFWVELTTLNPLAKDVTGQGSAWLDELLA